MIHNKICAVHNMNYTLGQVDKKLDFDMARSICILNKRIEIQVDPDMSKMNIFRATLSHGEWMCVVP